MSLYQKVLTFHYLKAHYAHDNLAPYLLLGYAQNSFKDWLGSDAKEDALAYGAGIAYALGAKAKLYIEYERAYKDKGFDQRAINDTLVLEFVHIGVHYRF